MSHFTTMQLSLHNKQDILAALKAMGCQVFDEHTTVTGYQGAEIECDFACLIPGTVRGYKVGFKRCSVTTDIGDETGYTVAADWWGAAGQYTERTFGKTLKREYAASAVVRTARAKGHRYSVNRVGETIQIQVRTGG